MGACFYRWCGSLVLGAALGVFGCEEEEEPERAGPCPSGEVHLSSLTAAEEIAHCEELDDVVIYSDVTLPALKRVNTLTIGAGVGMIEIGLPALESCGLIRSDFTSSIKSFSAPRLSSGTVSLETHFGPSLSLPALASGAVELRGHWGAVSLPQLQSADWLFVDAESLDVPQLRRVEGELSILSRSDNVSAPVLVEIGGDAAVASSSSVSMPALEVIGGRLMVSAVELDLPVLRQVGSVRLSYQPLSRLSLPALSRVEADFRMISNPSLTSLDLPLLTYVGTIFQVFKNESLPACDVDEVVQRLVAAGAPCGFHVGNNGPACP